MKKSRHLEVLRGMAEWCLSQHDPILTPTGRKKTNPTYWIRECDRHGLVTTSSGMPLDSRELCPTHLPGKGQPVSEQTTQGKPKSPRTVKCKGPTKLIEEITK